MASKQLGRLRQWAGEVMSSKDTKISVSDDYKALEAEIEVRKEGMLKIQSASEAYHRSLSKKKQHEALADNEKLLSLDALGVVMIVHGEQFGEDSPFGASLVKFGRAHCKVATLQEAYAVTFKDTFVASLQRFGDGIKEYEHLKKKLESRRSAYETAFNKAERLRQSKKEKEKDKLEAEEELDRAKQRFDETAEDVRAHMEAIRDDDAFHQRELTAFLDLEINFAQQYLEVLKDVKLEWNHDNLSTNRHKRNNSGLPKSLSRRSSSNARASVDPYADASPDSSDDEPDLRSASISHRRSSFHRNRSDSTVGSKPTSRPSSRSSRKRTSSTASEKDKEAVAPPRRLSVAGWASSAVESVTSRGGKKNNKDKDYFATLEDEDEEGSTGRRSSDWTSSLRKSTSIGSLGRKSPKQPGKDSSHRASPKVTQNTTKPGTPQEKRKIVRARFDYQAKSSNELTFQAGDEIQVHNEVLDAWWMGELNGKCGLFPTTHIAIVSPSKVFLPLPQVDKPTQTSNGPPSLISHIDVAQDDAQSFDDGYGTSELDEERELALQPMEHKSPFVEGLGDTHSIASQTTDDDGERYPTPRTPKQNPKSFESSTPKSREKVLGWASSSPEEAEQSSLLFEAGPLARSTAAIVPTAIAQTTSASASPNPMKKAPPPPPPRRAISSVPAPPLPERRTNISGSPRKAHTQHLTTASSLSSLTSSSGSGSSGEGYDRSPFESSLDLSVGGLSGSNGNGGASDKANPFRAW